MYWGEDSLSRSLWSHDHAIPLTSVVTVEATAPLSEWRDWTWALGIGIPVRSVTWNSASRSTVAAEPTSHQTFAASTPARRAVVESQSAMAGSLPETTVSHSASSVLDPNMRFVGV